MSADLVFASVAEVGSMPVQDLSKLITEANAGVVITSIIVDNIYYKELTGDNYLNALPKDTNIIEYD